MKDLKSMATADLVALYRFNKMQKDVWDNIGTDISMKKYYSAIVNELHNEISARIELLFPQLNSLIS